MKTPYIVLGKMRDRIKPFQKILHITTLEIMEKVCFKNKKKSDVKNLLKICKKFELGISKIISKNGEN